MSTVCIFADSVPLPYLFGKQAQQSAPQFGGGRSAVFAMLSIGESGAVNVTILIAGSRSFSILQVFFNRD